MYRERKENNAQKARQDKSFTDTRSTTKLEQLSTGSSIEVTRYSDGSSTHYFGGMGGSTDYDEFGNEC